MINKKEGNMIKKALLLISLCIIGVLHGNYCCAEISNNNQATPYYQNYVQQLLIPSGTPVRAILDETIDADDVREGDTVLLRVKQPVRVQGRTVIDANTLITAQVMNRENNFIFGIPGKLTVANFQIKLNDGSTMYLSGQPIMRKGDDRYWVNFIAPWFLIPLIFVKGDDAKIFYGYQQMLYTDRDVYVKI